MAFSGYVDSGKARVPSPSAHTCTARRAQPPASAWPPNHHFFTSRRLRWQIGRRARVPHGLPRWAASVRGRRASRALPTPPPCCLTHTLVCVLAGWLNSTQLNSPQLTSTQSNTLTTPPLPTAAAPPAAARDAVPCWSPHPQHTTTTLLNQSPPRPPFNLEPLGLHVGLLCGLLVVLCCSQNQNAPPGRHDRSSVVSAGGRCCVWTVRSSAFALRRSGFNYHL